MDCIFSNHCYQQWLEIKNCSSKYKYFVNIKSDLFSIFQVKQHNTSKWPQNSYIFVILEPIGTFVYCKRCSPPNMANKMSLNSYLDHHICLIFQIWLHNNASWQKGHLIVRLAHENPWSRSCVWSKVKVTFDLENSKVKVMVKFKPDVHIWGLGVQSICLLFISWQSDHFWLRYSKFLIWPWKFKVKVMAKVKPNGHIWALESNWYVCFSFCGNRTIFGWDIANSIFDLENSRSRSWQRSNPMVTFEP